jgi:hypothetical protein
MLLEVVKLTSQNSFDVSYNRVKGLSLVKGYDKEIFVVTREK